MGPGLKRVTYVTLPAFGGEFFALEFFVDFFLSGDGADSDWERAQESSQPPPLTRRVTVRMREEGPSFPHVAMSWTLFKETTRIHPNLMRLFLRSDCYSR